MIGTQAGAVKGGACLLKAIKTVKKTKTRTKLKVSGSKVTEYKFTKWTDRQTDRQSDAQTHIPFGLIDRYMIM